MAENMRSGVPQANGSVEVELTIDPQQVARAVVYMASLPLDANILLLTVMATEMPFVGRGYSSWLSWRMASGGCTALRSSLAP
jgi:hypothetical protein